MHIKRKAEIIMTENQNKSFTKDDAKRALKTLTSFGIQQGSKFANQAGSKMTEWSKKIGSKLDEARQTVGQHDLHDQEGPVDFDEFIKSIGSDDDLSMALFFGQTLQELPDDFDLMDQLQVKTLSQLSAKESENLVVDDLKFKLIKIEGQYNTVMLLQLVSDETDSNDVDKIGLVLLSVETCDALVDCIEGHIAFRPMPLKRYLKQPMHFAW